MSAQKKYALCFVDDDPDELSRFKNYLEKYYFIGVGKTLPLAVEDLRKTYDGKADLFVLDMYFPTKPNTDADREELDQTWEKFCAADNELKTVLARVEQTIDGGLKLAEEAKLRKAHFAFFTRKGNLTDAIKAYEDIGALSVIKKPDPASSGRVRSKLEIKNARDEAMMEMADQIKGSIDRAIDRARPSLSDQAFVAMWFTEELNTVYSQGIEPAIRAARYEPMIIRMKDHSNKIDDEIIAEIRKSTFLVADFTGHRGGVYFEAGFAMGLGIPVIWTCRKDDIDKLHFDIRQYNCIDWTKADELAKRLETRITNVVGRGQIVH